MTRLQWNERAFDLVHGPLGSGQLAALRAAAEAVETYYRMGATEVLFEREGYTYYVSAIWLNGGGALEHFNYNPL